MLPHMARDFSEKVERRLLELGWNQATLAERIGRKSSTVANWFIRGSVPRLDVAWEVARAIGLPVDYLADDEQKEPPPIGTAEERRLLDLCLRLGPEEAFDRLQLNPRVLRQLLESLTIEGTPRKPRS